MKYKQPLPSQAFYLPMSLLDALDWEEVMATYETMQSLDIAQSPYPRYDIVLPANILEVREDKTGEVRVWKPGDKWVVQIENENLHDAIFLTEDGGRISFIKTLQGNDDFDWSISLRERQDQLEKIIEGCVAYYRVLLVLLATRNIKRDTVQKKGLKLGVGDRSKYHEYVTTLKIGTITETETALGEPTGRTVRPHLRRGHVRNQKYGPDMAFVKRVFIQPVFVNSTSEVQNTLRSRYNVSGR